MSRHLDLQCDHVVSFGQRCIWLKSHQGDHYAPDLDDRTDHSGDIRIKLLRDRVVVLEKCLQELRVNACQLGDFMYGAVRECSQDMIRAIDAVLDGDPTVQRLDPDVVKESGERG